MMCTRTIEEFTKSIPDIDIVLTNVGVSTASTGLGGSADTPNEGAHLHGFSGL